MFNKAILSLTIFVTLLASGAPQSVNPCVGIRDQPIPAVSSNCAEFIYCSNEIPFKRTCPPPLFYNPPFYGCDKPENVEDCGGRYLDCRIQNGAHPSETSCSEYFQCNGGQKTQHRCPGQMIFDVRSRMCQLPAEAVCLPQYQN
jgi:hypothetical protein